MPVSADAPRRRRLACRQVSLSPPVQSTKPSGPLWVPASGRDVRRYPRWYLLLLHLPQFSASFLIRPYHHILRTNHSAAAPLPLISPDQHHGFHEKAPFASLKSSTRTFRFAQIQLDRDSGVNASDLKLRTLTPRSRWPNTNSIIGTTILFSGVHLFYLGQSAHFELVWPATSSSGDTRQW